MSTSYYVGTREGGEPKDKVLSRKQTAEYLGISVSSVDRLLKAKLIPHTRISGKPIFSRNRLDEWLLSKEKLPPGWEDECFRQQLIEATEVRERRNRLQRMNELRVLLTKIYAENKDEEYIKGLNNSEKVQREETERALTDEYLDLLNEEEELHEKEIERLKGMFGIERKDE